MKSYITIGASRFTGPDSLVLFAKRVLEEPLVDGKVSRDTLISFGNNRKCFPSEGLYPAVFAAYFGLEVEGLGLVEDGEQNALAVIIAAGGEKVERLAGSYRRIFQGAVERLAAADEAVAEQSIAVSVLPDIVDPLVYRGDRPLRAKHGILEPQFRQAADLGLICVPSGFGA